MAGLVNAYNITIGATGPTLASTGSSSSVAMACVRKDAPIKQSRTKIISAFTDALKDGVCTGDLGSNYQSAGIADIAAYTQSASAVAITFNTAGTAVGYYAALASVGTKLTAGASTLAPMICVRNGSQTGSDLAEYIPTSDTVGVGDIVSTDPKNDVMAMRSTTAYDHAVLGVIATQPGLVLGSQEAQSDGILALSGRVPAKVMTADPSQIKTGDYITTSGLKGVGMKLMQTGPTVGKALQTSADWSEEKCPVVDSYDAIVWPVSDGKNIDKSCFRIPTSSLPVSMQSKTTSPYVYVGKLMVLVNLSWADPNVVLANAGESANALSSVYALSARDTAALFVSTNDENGVTFEHTNGSTTAAIASASATLMGTTSHTLIDLTALIDEHINKSSIGGLEVMRSTIDRLNDRVASLEGVLSVGRVSSESAFVSNILGAATSASPSSGLVAGDLHVGGSALIEGVLNVIDNITAPNMVIGRWADFMGSAIFRGPIHFFGRPTVSSDTAGTAVIQKGQDSVSIVFKKVYDKSPVVTANLAVQGKDAQTATESAALDADLRLVVTNVTTQGFTVKLSKKASQDMPVSWMAIMVQDDSVAMGRE